MTSKIRFGKLSVALAMALVMTAPAGADRDSLKEASVQSVSGTVTASATPSGTGMSQSSHFPGSMDWLLMLGAFGLLGAVTRRGTPHPLQDPIYI